MSEKLVGIDDDDWIAPEECRVLAEQKLATIWDYARERSPFYRDYLPQRDLNTPISHQLARLPILTKADLLQNSPPESQNLLTGPLVDAYVFRSGGTTGSPKFSPFSRDEFCRWTNMFKRAYWAAGLRSSDRVGNLFVVGSMYASFIFVNRLVEELGCLNFPLTNHAAPEVVAFTLSQLGANTLMGMPSRMMELIATLPPEAAKKVEKLFYAGEFLYTPEREWLYQKLPNLKLIASGGYGAVDTGLMGYQCEAATGSIHHVFSDHIWMEIVDPDTGLPVEEGEGGSILITTLDRFLMPLLRYQIGDAARWIPGDCPCGRQNPRFELLGRSDDALRIGYATLGVEEALEAIANLPGVSTCIQVIKEREDRRDRLVLRVECSGDDSEALRESVLTTFRRNKPDLAKMEKENYIWPFQVEILPIGGIERVAITGKIRRAVDRSLGQ